MGRRGETGGVKRERGQRGKGERTEGERKNQSSEHEPEEQGRRASSLKAWWEGSEEDRGF